ncbi:MAG: hypothetical protein JXB88_21475 [Spirochaetales bacterium]|nr:hypothetical protein [Spirochaetales bacterium]
MNFNSVSLEWKRFVNRGKWRLETPFSQTHFFVDKFAISTQILCQRVGKQKEIKEIKGKEEEEIKHSWYQFQNCKKEYFSIHSQIPNNIIVIENFQNPFS